MRKKIFSRYSGVILIFAVIMVGLWWGISGYGHLLKNAEQGVFSWSGTLIVLSGATLILVLACLAVLKMMHQSEVEAGNLRSLVSRHTADLEQSEDHYRTLVENLRDGVAIIDPEFHKIFLSNSALLRLLGIEIPISENDQNILENFLWAAVQSVEKQKPQKSMIFISSYPVVTSKGKSISLEITCKPVEYNRRPALMMIMRETSGQKQAEDALHRKAIEFASLYALSRSLATQADPDKLLDEVLEDAMALLSTAAGEILIYDSETDDLEVKLAIGVDVPAGLHLKKGSSISGKVAESLSPVVVKNYSSWEGRLPIFDSLHLTAAAGVPLLYGGQLLGVLTVFESNSSQRQFTEADVRLLTLFASQAAAAVQSARLLNETRQQLKDIETINRISSIFRNSQALEKLLPSILSEILSIFGTDTGMLWLYDLRQKRQRDICASGWLKKVTDVDLDPNVGILGQVISSEKIYLSSDFSADPATSEPVRKVIPPGWGGICAPIQTEEGVIGVILMMVQQPRQFTRKDMRHLQTVTEVAANAIQRARLYERTEKQLKRISALYNNDTVINTNLDLSLILKILLNQVAVQLQVDAADILLYHPDTNSLEFAAGRGMRTSGIDRIQIRVEEDLAGQAILEGRRVSVYNLPESDARFKRSELFRAERFISYYGVPLVSKGVEVGVLEVFHRSLLDPDTDWIEFLDALAAQAAIALDNARLVEGLQKSNLELTHAYDSTIEGWVQALDMRDAETEGHSMRVADKTMRLARLAGIKDENLIHIWRGALLHDIGKMAIPDDILRKPGALTEAEWKVMRLHPEYAYRMLTPITFLGRTLDIPYCHHEKWDGSGYPRRLKGEEIPLTARLFAVIDVWDALKSDRPYRPAWTTDKTMEYILAQSGKHFDPEAVKMFIKMTAAANQPLN